MELYDIIKEAPDIKPAPVTGGFKTWLESPEGQRQLSKGISVEKEHTTKHEVARKIAIHHLKEDREYYIKMAKVGLDEGIYDNPEDARRDTVDDLVDQGGGDEVAEIPINMNLALKAVQNPVEAKKFAARSSKSHKTLLGSLKTLMDTARTLMQTLPAPAMESSMGVAGPMIPNPEVDPGSGVPIKDPLRKKNDRRKPVPAKRLKLGSPADGGMVGTNPMVPGRSAFAKAIE